MINLEVLNLKNISLCSNTFDSIVLGNGNYAKVNQVDLIALFHKKNIKMWLSQNLMKTPAVETLYRLFYSKNLMRWKLCI